MEAHRHAKANRDVANREDHQVLPVQRAVPRQPRPRSRAREGRSQPRWRTDPAARWAGPRLIGDDAPFSGWPRRPKEPCVAVSLVCGTKPRSRLLRAAIAGAARPAGRLGRRPAHAFATDGVAEGSRARRPADAELAASRQTDDLVKGARWRRLEIYNDCYRLVGWACGDRCADPRPREVVCVALQRPDGDFGESASARCSTSSRRTCALPSPVSTSSPRGCGAWRCSSTGWRSAEAVASAGVGAAMGRRRRRDGRDAAAAATASRAGTRRRVRFAWVGPLSPER